MNIRYTGLFIVFLLITNAVFATQVEWAHKVLGYTQEYQSDQNHVLYALGPPVVNPGRHLYDEKDPYHQGYVLNPDDGKKDNIIIVGFKEPMRATQLVIGGLFDRGIFKAVHLLKYNDQEQMVYQHHDDMSDGRFKKFHVQFEKQYVRGVKLVMDHSKIKDWNLIKGIGITNAKQEYDFRPDVIQGVEVTADKISVGERVNSEDCFEFSPKIAPDGRSMYFVRMCGENDDQDIWCSGKQSEGWRTPYKLDAPLNNEGHNFVASITLDGQSLLLGNVYTKDSETMRDGVSITHQQYDGDWTFPEEIEIPAYNNKNDHANFYLSADRKHLLMALEDDDSYGGLDLYVAHNFYFRDGWTEPRNLGEKVNTPFTEDYPYLAPDGKTLYFSSNGYSGYGGLDIMMVKRQGNSWDNWSKPKNLGKHINSKADDKGFTITTSGDHAYFNSFDPYGDMHHMDIYKVSLPEHLHQTKRILVKGRLKDAESTQAVNGAVRYRTLDEDDDYSGIVKSRTEDGYYAVSLPHGNKYKFTVEAPEYFETHKMIDLKGDDTGLEYGEVDFNMIPFVEEGETYTINSMQYAMDSVALTSRMKGELDTLYNILREQSKAYIEIGGHTDSIGSADYNRKLSLQRVNQVAEYLVSKGVDERRMVTKGYGEAKPIATNGTEAGRSKNRRVVITFISREELQDMKRKNN